MELFNKIKNKSCFRGCISVLLAIIFIPGLLYLFLLLYGKYHTFDRSFVANVKSVGYEISFTEMEYDSILAFVFSRKGEKEKVSTLFVHNNAWDVVSFIFTKDSIFIRDEMEFFDLFSPKERVIYLVPPKDFKKHKIIKGNMPSSCYLIPYSDPRFFVFDENKHKYIQKDSAMHIIKLVHLVERANAYSLFDETLKDTLMIHLNEYIIQ